MFDLERDAIASGYNSSSNIVRCLFATPHHSIFSISTSQFVAPLAPHTIVIVDIDIDDGRGCAARRATRCRRRRRSRLDRSAPPGVRLCALGVLCVCSFVSSMGKCSSCQCGISMRSGVVIVFVCRSLHRFVAISLNSPSRFRYRSHSHSSIERTNEQ